MAESRIDLDVFGAPHCVDRAVAARDGVEARLVGAKSELVSPVDALLVSPVLGDDIQAAADVGDRRIREVSDELAERTGLPCAVRVGEGHDLGVYLAHRIVLRGDLPTAWITDDAGAGRLRKRFGPIRGRVRAD